MKIITAFSVLLISMSACGQRMGANYEATIDQHRSKYKHDFVTDENSPLKAVDTAFLRFYPANEHYAVSASFTLTPESKPFDMPTHSGAVQQYRKYGTVQFLLQKDTLQLAVYQSLSLLKKPEYANHLFIPFNDLTNYETTYAGGRYLDLKIDDIKKKNTVLLDFNKCYNPYCAYSDGYSCPIPPDENKLNVRIDAGEMMFGREKE